MKYTVTAGHKIQTYLNKMKAGDSITISAGVYKEKITLKTSKITINANNAILDGGKKSGTLVNVYGDSITINGLEVRNLNGLNACGINVQPGVSYLTLNNVKIHNISCPSPAKEDHCANAILAYADTSKKINNISINNCEIYDIVSGWGEAVSFYGYCRDISIYKCKVYNCGNIGIDICGNAGDNSNDELDFPIGATIKECSLTNCKNTTYDKGSAAAIYVDGAQKVTIQGNKIVSCDCGIEAGAEVKVADKYSTNTVKILSNNISNCSYGIKVGGYEKNLGWVFNTEISSNTVSSKYAAIQLAKVNKCTVKNNILKGSSMIAYEWGNESSYTKSISINGNKSK